MQQRQQQEEQEQEPLLLPLWLLLPLLLSVLVLSSLGFQLAAAATASTDAPACISWLHVSSATSDVRRKIHEAVVGISAQMVLKL